MTNSGDSSPLKDDEIGNCELTEAFFYSVPSQGNIYTFKPLKFKNSLKFLTSSLHKKVFCLDCSEGKPLLQEVTSCCMGSKADIISLDAYYSSKVDDFIIGITYTKLEAALGNNDYGFSIFLDPGIQNCQDFNVQAKEASLELDYVPYQLYHTYLDSSEEIIWLLSGSDCHIHCYCLPSGGDAAISLVDDVESSFPEFSLVTGITLDMNIVYNENFKSRITITCGENGTIQIFNVGLSSEGARITSSRSIELDYPVITAKFFYINSSFDTLFFEELGPHTIKEENLTMVIAASLESSFTLRFNEKNLDHLPDSNLHDVVSCCLVCDLNFDGINEILLGTFGQKVLIYSQSSCETGWTLCNTLDLPSPIFSLAYEDVYRDGVNELVVFTMAGIHIFQHLMHKMASLVLFRLRNMKDSFRNQDK